MAVQLKRTKALGSLSITPLIDVVFLLLIFFLVSSKLDNEEPQLELNLPQVSAAFPASVQPNELIVNIDREGQFFIDGQFCPLEQVQQIITRAHTNNPETQNVVIRADKQVEWENVVAIIDFCRQIGVNNCSATTDDN
jgi:biopolymer transport protein ExbD